MIDMLQIMFEKQEQLQMKLGTLDKLDSPQNRQQYINQMVLALVEESIEILRETPYKNPDFVKFGWKKNQLGNEENYKEEIVDLFHFMMNLCIVVNMDAKEFFDIYCKKNNINHKRKKDNY